MKQNKKTVDDLVDWIDENGNLLGVVTRSRAHLKGLLHRLSVIYLLNNKKQILIQVRAKDSKWDHSVGGHVDAGEDHKESAVREMEEELGIKNLKIIELEESVIEYPIQGRKDQSHHFFKIYVGFGQPGEINPLEVKDVFWADPYQLAAKMKKDLDHIQFTPGIKTTISTFLKYLKQNQKSE
ncbi:NUDIX domain-containing protein [Candidatus Daviesbacteria bacterium]|nr:NUDIX domain-containing protein [Candidatus Daviesbacteria bacterium]